MQNDVLKPSKPRQVICIEYPGNIQNPDKAIETLAGTEQIAKVRITEIAMACQTLQMFDLVNVQTIF